MSVLRNGMKILITDNNTFTGANLKIGKYYQVEPADTGTSEQNRCWHSLLQEYWSSGYHSYNATSFEHFRELVKLYLGAGVEKYRDLVDDNGDPVKEPVIKWRLKSWRDYSKKERMESIDRLIAEMVQAGVNTKKFSEILQGMEQNSMRAVS